MKRELAQGKSFLIPCSEKRRARANKKAHARQLSFSFEGNGNTPAQDSESLAQCSNTVS